MHAGDARELGFEMEHRAEARILLAQISESAAEQREELGFVMIGLGADFDQLDKIRGGLRPPKIFTDAAKRIFQSNFRQRMQVRLPAPRDLYFHFEEEIQFAREWTLRAPSASSDGLDAA